MSVLSFLANILMVGHSLIGPDLPPLVAGGMAAMGQPAEVQAQIINGAPLGYQWDHGSEAEGVDARKVLARSTTDVLVLTEAQPLADHLQWSDSAGQVAAWAGAAWDGNPGTQVFLYETWPSRNGEGAWTDRIAADLPGWQGLVDAANAARPAGAPAVRLIPAGQAMARLAQAAAAGKVPGADGIADFFDDDIHPNGRGRYFVALVHLAAITGQSPEGLPARLTRSLPDRDSVVPEDMAAALQRIAADAVASFRAAEVAVPAVTRAAVLTPVTNPNLGLNLAGIADWSVQQPFLNVMKTARPWIAHRPGQWGGWENAELAAAGQVDAGGWPRRLPEGATGLSTLVLTDLPAAARSAAGRYVLTWAGGGTIEVSGRATDIAAGPNRIAFDFTPGAGSVVITLTAPDPADPLRDMVLVREDRAQALAAGAVFNPDWLARIRGTRMVRFMDWMATNGSTVAHPGDRPRLSDFTWAAKGVPLEVMVALTNDLQADPWFCVPHLADDALVREMATVVKAGLAPGLRAYVEYSNEVWNWQFPQAAWADAMAKARWGRENAWVQYYALRAAEVAEIWHAAFADDRRLVRVMSSQTGWQGLEADILDAPLVVAEGRPAPRLSFDAYAVTGYFAAGLGTPEKAKLVKDWLAESQLAARDAAAEQGLSGAAAAAYVAAHGDDLALDRAARELESGAVSGRPEDTLDTLLTATLPYHAAVARRAGLDLMMYEGGSHVVGAGALVEDAELAAFFERLNYSPAMGALYARLLAGWAEMSPAPFAAFLDVQAPSKWGNWGALRTLDDDNPRWQALARGCAPC